MGIFSSLKSKSSGVPKTTKATAGRIKNILGLQQLPAMPAFAAKAFEAASDPGSQASDFVKIISSDEAISSRIIRIANSVYFYRGTPADDIEKAVANIGLDELRALLAASMLKNLLRVKTNARKQVWANAISTAMLARKLTRMVPNVSAGEAFLGGLVHDVGKLVMLERNGPLYDKVIMEVSGGEKTFCEAEDETFEVDHVEVGQWVAESWCFPASTIEAIAYHHKPWPKQIGSMKASKNLGLLIKVADTFTHHAGFGHPMSYMPFREAIADDFTRAKQELNLSDQEADSVIKSTEQEFEQNRSLYEDDM